MVQESHHAHVEGLGISCDLCDSEGNGACEIQISTDNKEKSNLPEGRYLEHEHEEANQMNIIIITIVFIQIQITPWDLSRFACLMKIKS